MACCDEAVAAGAVLLEMLVWLVVGAAVEGPAAWAQDGPPIMEPLFRGRLKSGLLVALLGVLVAGCGDRAALVGRVVGVVAGLPATSSMISTLVLWWSVSSTATSSVLSFFFLEPESVLALRVFLVGCWAWVEVAVAVAAEEGAPVAVLGEGVAVG